MARFKILYPNSNSTFREVAIFNKDVLVLLDQPDELSIILPTFTDSLVGLCYSRDDSHFSFYTLEHSRDGFIRRNYVGISRNKDLSRALPNPLKLKFPLELHPKLKRFDMDIEISS